MKTIKNSKNQIKRVPDEEAFKAVRSGNWEFCPKSVWKEAKADPTKTTKPSKKKKKRTKKAEAWLSLMKNAFWKSVKLFVKQGYEINHLKRKGDLFACMITKEDEIALLWGDKKDGTAKTLPQVSKEDALRNLELTLENLK